MIIRDWTAAVERLVHHATILEMNVQSYRRCAAGAPATQRSVGAMITA